MNTPQTISALGASITPFRAVADDADFVAIQSGPFGPPPSFIITFGKLIPEVPAVPGTPAVPQKSGPNRPDYVPSAPAVPETPAVPARFIPHRQETLELDQAEWDNWNKEVSDRDYILSIVAKRFGVTFQPTA